MNDVLTQSLATIIPTIALILGLYYFQSKQSAAMENRLREDIRDVKSELRAEIKEVSDSVETAKSELRAEIKEVSDSVETAKSDCAPRSRL